MKIIHLLFALYFLFLSVYPCSDKETCADDRKAGIAFVDNGSHDHTNSEQDSCTPFCICSCCAAHIKLSSVSDIDFAGVIHNTKQTIPYLENLVLSDHNHIWQPPRI